MCHIERNCSGLLRADSKRDAGDAPSRNLDHAPSQNQNPSRIVVLGLGYQRRALRGQTYFQSELTN